MQSFMKRILLAGVPVILLGALTEPLESQAPAPPPRTHQTVNPDRSVTFRFIDDTAARVELVLDDNPKPVPMAKDSGGVWSVTTPPLRPAIYGFAFLADGQPRIDPYNRYTIGNVYFSAGSLVEVPGDSPEPWDLTPVAHGEIHRHIYTTRIALGVPENQSEYVVYTPPGYNPAAKETYPVLYLLHGWSHLPPSWIETGRAQFILDNLIAQGKAKPMVVVMPLGYGDTAFLKDYNLWGNDEAINHNLGLFSDALLTEIIPRIESEYRVSKDRSGRAIAGFSMGGLEALSVGLHHTDKFAYVGGFSAAVHREAFIKSLPVLTPKATNLKLLWVACGTGDGLIEANRNLVKYLKSQDMPVTAIETTGLHTWPVWRENLANFAPLLFQSK